MISDFWLVVRWWGTLFLVGAAAFPLTRALFAGKQCYKIRDRERKNNKQKIILDETEKDSLGWWDEGYFFAKAVGMAVVAWLVYAMGTLRIFPFTTISIVVSLVILLLLGLFVNLKSSIFNFQSISNFKFQIENSKRLSLKMVITLFLEEVFFLIALLLWTWVKAHEPSIRGLEKFMDYGFMQSILSSRFFPPADMWYAGLPINYYYFGHLVTAVLTRFSGMDLSYTFNLMLATLFALTATMSFSTGVELILRARPGRGVEKTSSRVFDFDRTIKALSGGLLTAFLVTLAGNMQTIYAFTKGYSGDNVKPFWTLLWKAGEFWTKLPEGLNRYWYANATRFIPFTIHEFPSYSFVVSDLHGHVLSLPFVLLAIGLLIQIFVIRNQESGIRNYGWLRLGFYGFLVGVLLMTNALDGPIYFGLFLLLFIISASRDIIQNWEWWKEKGIKIGLVIFVAAITSLPFLAHFKSFVSGLAINCPPSSLANSRIGPFLFEAVEKCQRSPFWMMWLLWGFFIYCGVWLIVERLKTQDSRLKVTTQKSKFFKLKEMFLGMEFTRTEKILLVFFLFSLGLIIFPEFFYFKDIYPAHFRSNTMFKLGYQSFIMFSIVAGYTIITTFAWLTQSSRWKFSIFNFQFSMNSKKIFILFLLPQLFLVSIYPLFSVRSYFGGLQNYEGIYGLGWLQKEYPADYSAIGWLNRETSGSEGGPTVFRFVGLRGATMTDLPVIVEADGDSYTDYARFSVFTGMPTIIGWPVHEWLWRGTYDVVAPRREEVREIYESRNLGLTKNLLDKYGAIFVIVGRLERQKYQNLYETKFLQWGTIVYRFGDTVIYQLKK